MYQCNDTNVLRWELTVMKEKNANFMLALDTAKSELKDSQDSNVVLEAKVHVLEDEVVIGLQTTGMFNKNTEDAQKLLVEFHHSQTMS